MKVLNFISIIIKIVTLKDIKIFKLKAIKIKFLLVILLSLAPYQSSFCQTVPVTTDSRIRTLVYNPNEVYQLKFHYGYQSFIEFGEDEEIEMISIGESFAWRLTPSGKRLFVRPLEIAAHTNMTIITNRRTYHFDIRSGEYDGKADEELVYTVRFYYPSVGQSIPITPQLINTTPSLPNKEADFAPSLDVKNNEAQIKNEPKTTLIFANNVKNLNFDYSLAGKSAIINVLKIYDNGKETFFEFANNNSIIPSISSVDEFGTERPLNHIIRDNYIVVPVVVPQFTLRLADSLICVYNNQPPKKDRTTPLN
jgi:type IV secretion system protein VirB9